MYYKEFYSVFQARQYEIINYEYLDEDGESICEAIVEDNSIAAFRIVKKCSGAGKEQIYAVQTNFDMNR